MTADPAMGFWLRYVERAGGLWEDAGEVATAVLPPGLDDLGLGEVVDVTADPEVAREDGAQMLGPGHPALDRAAEDVVAGGDAGCAHLPWPTSAGPSVDALQERARERLAVERGRLEVATPLTPCYAPLLRVGALATYTLSLEERIQERAEMWVDARTGASVGERAARVVEHLPLLDEPDADHPRLPVAVESATARADAALEEKARARLGAYEAATAGAREAERSRAEAYFAATLERLQRRRESVPQERVAALEAQVDATQAERARRLREIDEAYEPGLDLRPFRLHLVWAPALRAPARVRRGSVTHALGLVWLLAPLAVFTPLACPACGADAPLVATRERLACRACAS